MIRFILNNKEVSTGLPPGTLLLDFIRYQQYLTGTKIGCREGDCGACTVLIGEIIDDKLNYRSATSCLTPLGNIGGKHVVTVEGVNMEALNPFQQAICDEAGTQCGFCTPGFVVSIAGFCLSEKEPTYKNALAAVDGNICRCTGYKSIERALVKVSSLMESRTSGDPVKFAVAQSMLPAYFAEIAGRLKKFSVTFGDFGQQSKPANFLGGGTDLYVQQHDSMVHADIDFLVGKPELKGIVVDGSTCIIGAAATVTDLVESEIIQEHFPEIGNFVKLISSTPIRNIATIAGNFVNASPIGDLTVIFLALDAILVLSNGSREREIPLRQFYKGYKQLDKKHDEYVSDIHFQLPEAGSVFNFEKVSKRTHLDIASVNTAIKLELEDGIIRSASISAGGVAPIPAYLFKTSEFLQGKVLSEDLILAAIELAQTEVAPISDARGAEGYKRLLLSQLLKAHFLKLFPHLEIEKLIRSSR